MHIRQNHMPVTADPTVVANPAHHATRRSRGRKGAVIIVAALLLATAGAVTSAWWTGTGTGVGTATTGTSTKFTIASATAVGTITPDGPGQTVEFTVTNPGPETETLTNVAVTLADSAGAAWVPTDGCLFADYAVAMTTAPTYAAIAKDRSLTGTVTVTLEDTDFNQDACQGQVVPLYFVAS
jgi:hypothetical protein